MGGVVLKVWPQLTGEARCKVESKTVDQEALQIEWKSVSGHAPMAI